MHLQLASTRMVKSLATVTRAPSSTVLSRISCESVTYRPEDTHLMFSSPRIQGGDFSMFAVSMSYALMLTSPLIARGDGTGGKVI